MVEASLEPRRGSEVGTVKDLDDLRTRYAAFCSRTFPGVDLEGLHLALDCANGATYKAAPEVFRGLGAWVSALNDSPDGVNINDGCGSEHPAGLAAKVVESGAALGLAFDGDGDRVRVVDEQGSVLTGDQVIALCWRTTSS
jgi:phosphoglucosamine mutase